MSLLLPPLDGRIEVKGLLGEGGMGQVFRAWDQSLQRAVAVKFVRGSDPREAERLLLEARLQARVEHPHVVRVHEVGTLEGRPCIVLQLVEGGTLADLPSDTPQAVRVELLRQAAQGLHAAHLQGLIHRDMKPGNVLTETSEDGILRALVSDFGLARDEDGGLTRSGLPAGTLDFMAPEVLLGAGPVDFRVDVYALGATAYALLSGQLPFRTTATQAPATPGSAQSTAQADSTRLLRRILEEDPAPLVTVPPDLRLIVAKAMEKTPADRYASAEAFGEDLARYQRGEPILAERLPPFDRLLRWGRRNPTAARASVSALLTVVLGLGFGFWTTRRAARQNLEAARLGALAEAMEARVRQEQLSPPHDLTPVRSQVRSHAARLEAAAGEGGPAAFARGRALELLGDWTRSRVAFQRAWDTGFRNPQAADSLGLALIRIYDQDLRRGRATLAPEALKALQAHLDRSLHDPALALLAQGDPAGWRGPWARAIHATLHRQFDAARQEARTIRQRDPQRYEAWTLEGEIWNAEAHRRAEEGKDAEARAALEQAQQCLDQALAWGRSDQRPLEALARLHIQRAALQVNAGADTVAETASAGQWIERAMALTPDNPELLAQKAASLYQQALSPQPTAWPVRGRLCEQAIQFLDQAAALRPGTPSFLTSLTEMWGSLALVQINQGQSARTAVERGLARIREAEALTPEDPGVPRLDLFMRTREYQVLRAEGKDPEPALRAGLASAARALQLNAVNPASVQTWRITLQMELGREAWRHKKDPRPELMGAAADVETLLKQAPDSLPILQNAANSLYMAADQLTDLDGEVDRLTARAVELADQGLTKAPGHEALLRLKGQILMVQAYWDCLQDREPGRPLAEARRVLTAAAGQGKGMVVFNEVLAVLSLVEARWALQQGRSPEAALSDVERRLQPLLKSPNAQPGVYQNLALAALVRGQWAQRNQLPSQEKVKVGQAAITQAIQQDPGDPGLRVVQARLHALGGDKASGMKSLEAARDLNALVAGGPEYRRALKELGQG